MDDFFLVYTEKRGPGIFSKPPGQIELVYHTDRWYWGWFLPLRCFLHTAFLTPHPQNHIPPICIGYPHLSIQGYLKYIFGGKESVKKDFCRCCLWVCFYHVCRHLWGGQLYGHAWPCQVSGSVCRAARSGGHLRIPEQGIQPAYHTAHISPAPRSAEHSHQPQKSCLLGRLFFFCPNSIDRCDSSKHISPEPRKTTPPHFSVPTKRDGFYHIRAVKSLSLQFVKVHPRLNPFFSDILTTSLKN